MNHYYIYKSQGDIIYSLPAIQAHGGGIIITGLPADQYNSLKPIMNLQPGITGFFHESEVGLPKGFINLEEFRYIQENPMHIVESFAKVLAVNIGHKWRMGWLENVIPNEPGEYAVINITARYRDKVFSYKKVLDEMHEKRIPVVFIGALEERDAFQKQYPKHQIKWIKTHTWLDAANIIYGARYFIGTQSCCLAIAEGLGRSYRYERSPFFDNVMTGRSNETILNNHTRKIHFSLSRIQEVYRNLKK